MNYQFLTLSPSGMTTFFYLLFLFPLAILGMMFLSPMFVILLIVCIVLFVAGAIFIEKEQKDPKVQASNLFTVFGPTFNLMVE